LQGRARHPARPTAQNGGMIERLENRVGELDIEVHETRFNYRLKFDPTRSGARRCRVKSLVGLALH
jgi:hypothetical protein